MSYRVSIVGAGWSSCLKKTCAVGHLRTCAGKDRRDSYRLWARTQGLPSYQQLADAGLSAAGVILKFVFIVAVFLGCISTRIIKYFGAVEECRHQSERFADKISLLCSGHSAFDLPIAKGYDSTGYSKISSSPFSVIWFWSIQFSHYHCKVAVQCHVSMMYFWFHSVKVWAVELYQWCCVTPSAVTFCGNHWNNDLTHFGSIFGAILDVASLTRGYPFCQL